MKRWLLSLGLMAALRLAAEPHPETGEEFWAIQAKPVPGEVIAFGHIARLTFAADDLGRPLTTRVEFMVDRLLGGVAVTNAVIIEPGERFQQLTFNRDITKTFVFHLRPSRERAGFITYWDGYGVREAAAADALVFERGLRAWQTVTNAPTKAAQREAMMDWGLRCAGDRITRWDGVLAIRDAIHPGDEYRDHEKAMRVMTPERWRKFREVWRKVRDETPRDYRIGTVMLEAGAWLTPEPYFHHEVRLWSAKLIDDEARWARHFDDFWQEVDRRRKPPQTQR